MYDEGQFKQECFWKAESAEAAGERQALYRALHALLKPLPLRKRSDVLKQLRVWSGSDGACRPEYRALTAGEVAALERWAGINRLAYRQPLDARRDQVIRTSSGN